MALAKLSETGGTPDYISPEEVKGIRGDARSDIYSLGVMLFEMLTGKTPFEGCNALTLMNDRLINDPPLVRAIAPEIPSWLEQVTGRALERDPRRRYTSAFEFACDLKSEGHLSYLALRKRVESGKNRWPWAWLTQKS
jgi:eukaryotic-like serine/threonine-protein kinase